MRRTSRRSPRTSITAFRATAPRRASRRIVFRPALSQLEDRTLLATMMWENPAGGDWDTASNWVNAADPNDQHVPTASDDAVINLPDVTVTHDSGTDSANSLTISSNQSALDISGGSLALNSTSSIVGSLTVDGATLSTAGSLTVSGSMSWSGGTISGFGTLTIGSQATLSLNVSNNQVTETLDGVTLDNAGAASLGGDRFGPLALENNAGIDNQPGASFTFLSVDGVSVTTDGTATSFKNEGALIQTGSGGENEIEPAFTQTATGSTAVQTGELEFIGDSTITGPMTGNAGTLLYFGGSAASFDASSSITSAGTVELQGPTVTEDGTYDVSGGTQVLECVASFNAPITNLGSDLVIGAATLDIASNQSFSFTGLEINQGTLSGGGSADLTVTSSMSWSGGTISGFGTLTIGSQATLSLNVSNNQATETLDGVTLDNAGAASLGGDRFGPLALENNAGIDNQPGASFTFLSVDGVSVTTDGTATSFKNEGALIQTGSGGENEIEPAFTQTATGSTAVQTGELEFIGDSTITGPMTGNAGTLLYFGGSAADLEASSSITTAGSVQFAGPTVTVGLGGASAGQYARVTVSGTASLSGMLNVALVNNFQPAVGNTFEILTFGSSTGNFTAYNGLSLGAGVFVDPVFKASSLTLDTDQVAISGAPAFSLMGIPITVTGSVTGPSAGDAFTFSWTVTQNGNPFSSGTGTPFSFTPNVNGTYVVGLTVAETAGGKGTASVPVIVGPSIFVLDPSTGGALSISGNASINLPGGVYVNSSSSTALSASGNAKIKATVIDVHGGVSKIGNASFSPTPTTGAAVAADPYASLAEPSTSGLTNYGSESLSGNASATIKPGVYSGISVSGNGTLTLDSGLYVIEGGGFSISGNASVTGSDVTIFNAGNKYPTTGGTYGGISLSGNGTYNLTPPTSGTYAGIVIFQSRDNSKALTISGNASGMNGTIYAPAAALTESGNAQLSASIDVDTLTISGNGVSNTVAPSSPAGTVAYSPAQIRSAYGISSLAYDGTGETIAIVDAYDDPSILQGVDAFDSQFGLTTSGPTLYQQYGPASSFLTVLNQVGQATSLPSTDPNGPGTDNWEVEEALDVEWMHAIAPGAQIILVEATSQSLSDLMAGVATAAAQPGVSVVSMSWGFAEGQAVFAGDEAAYDNVFNVPGVTFVASTGDYGAADPEYPAFSPNVVAVGGTSLTLNGDGSYGGETGWGYLSSPAGTFIGSGGGISLYESEPAYQQGVQSTGMRTTPDVSLVADPATGAWIADTYNLDPSNPFEVVGGTSLSAPAWAGLVALVNQGRAAAGESTLNSSSPTETQQALYMLPQSDYNAILGGTNGYTAGAGYNLVTGLGTPVANLLVPDLVAYDGPGTTYSGPTVGALQNANLVNAGMSDSGPMDVFSVFDSLTVTSNGVNRNGAVTTVDTKVDRGLARPLPGTERTAIPTLDRALEVLQDENVQETLIGDLAFEQVAKDPRRA